MPELAIDKRNKRLTLNQKYGTIYLTMKKEVNKKGETIL